MFHWKFGRNVLSAYAGIEDQIMGVSCDAHGRRVRNLMLIYTACETCIGRVRNLMLI